jgi:hypothetical protein
VGVSQGLRREGGLVTVVASGLVLRPLPGQVFAEMVRSNLGDVDIADELGPLLETIPVIA